MRYPCKITRVIDGDTVSIQVELGFGLVNSFRGRLAGLDAPEVRTRDAEEKHNGLLSKARLEQLCNQAIEMQCFVEKKQDKYGRYVVTLYGRYEKDTVFQNINTMLIAEGHAQEKEY